MPQTPPSPLSRSLSLGHPHTALSYLITSKILSPTFTPSTSQSALEASLNKLKSSHLTLLQTSLPILLLPSQSHPFTLYPLLSHIHLIPASDPIPSLPKSQLEDLSTVLAQDLSTLLSDFIDTWNSLFPSLYSISTPLQISPTISRLYLHLRSLQSETLSLNLQLTSTRALVTSMYQASLSTAISTTQLHLAQRTNPKSADFSQLRMLDAKRRATAAKLRLQRAEIAANVYSHDAVRALKKVATRVSQRRDEVNYQITKGERLLRQYRAQGLEFEAVVDAIVSARRRLEGKVWERDQLVGKEP